MSVDDAITRVNGIGVAEATPEHSIDTLARRSGKDPVLLLGTVMAAQGKQ